MIKHDYHMHTNYSIDSNATMESMIQSAIKKGFTEIALTDHIDFLHDNNLNYEDYIPMFYEMRDKYKKQISILLGVEMGLGSASKGKDAELINKFPFDFAIASSHDIMGLDLWNKSFFVGRDKKTAYTEYFCEIIDNIKTYDHFCVYGHLDFIIRYATYSDNSIAYKDYADYIDIALKLLIEKGKGIEINTSGFRYQLNTTHPKRELIARYLELGGEIITVGSDAHSPKDVGMKFDYVEHMLKDLGVKRICKFKEMQPIFVEL